jgi:hypothetical protein
LTKWIPARTSGLADLWRAGEKFKRQEPGLLICGVLVDDHGDGHGKKFFWLVEDFWFALVSLLKYLLT